MTFVALLLAGMPLTAAPQTAAGQARGGRGSTPPFAGYAYPECGPADAPGIHLVLSGGAAPEAVPAKPPRPAIEMQFNRKLHPFSAQPATFRVDSPRGPVAMSCPVIGTCMVAESGEVTIQRREGDGALTGEFRIVWPDGTRKTVMVRQFAADWIEAPTKCR